MADNERKAYRCNSCSWRFRRAHNVRLCPNCGKETVLLDSSSGAAEDLLREIEDMERQFGGLR